MKKGFYKKMAFSALLIVVATSSFGQTWEEVGGSSVNYDEAHRLSIGMGSNNWPYVAYQNKSSSANKGYVKAFNGTSWVNVGDDVLNDSQNNLDYLSFAVHGTIPYVAYQSHYTAAGSYQRKLTVKKFNGTSWVAVGAEMFSANWAEHISLAINSAGVPYVAYSDGANSYKVTVNKFNGTSWETVGTAGFSVGAPNEGASAISLTFNSSDVPFVAYSRVQGGESRDANVMKFDGTNWVSVGNTNFSGGAAGNMSLKISNSGEPYVAYVEYGGAPTAVVMKFDGTDWNPLNGVISTESVVRVSLALNNNDVPHLALTKDGGSGKDGAISVVKHNGTNWVAVGNVLDEGSVSLVFDDANEAYLAISEALTKTPMVVKFLDATATPAAPTTLTATANTTPLSVSLTWADNATDETGYEVERSTDGTTFTNIASLNANTTSYTDETVSENTTYHYRVFAYNTDGNSDFSNIAQATTGELGIKDNELNAISLYPNPASEMVTITNLPTGATVTIIDLTGKEVYSSATASEQVTISTVDFTNGVYVIRLENNGMVANKKLIVNK